MAPTPLPLESGNGASHLEGVGSSMGGQLGTISLGMLIQYINQRTYSDLLNLAEILPRKADLDKKIVIVQFAQRTRQLYVRLLALVKWAASASKVDKCCHITAFLEKQNNLIVDTADKLFHMTRENLVLARLPHFHIPAAVETLTTGSYDRLPLAIRQRILPPEPITSGERKHTLTRLEQIIQHRLVTAELPPQMRTTKIENGRVRFTVDHEFEVSLTLMSDGHNEPWRMLEVDILVEDRETGEGKALVHPLQVSFIHQLVQSRLQDNPNPLLEVYTVLHSFCQSLQLEVLYAQTLKLLDGRLDYHIRVEEYLQGKSLTLTYWRELTHKDPNVQLGYRLTVQVDPSQHSRPLMLLHTPSLGSKESEIAEKAIRSDQLSIERLLVHTIYLRTKARLTELKQELDSKLGPEAEKCSVSGSPAVLHVPFLQPCFRSEQLLITVDTHTGVLLAHVPQYEFFPRIKDLQNSLNQDKSKLDEQLSDLRFWVMVRRTEKTLQHLEATAHERLPLMYGPTHPLQSLSKHKVYIAFHRHPTYILIVEFHERAESCCEIDMKMYLLVVKEASIEDNPEDDSVQTSVPRSYLRAYRLMPLDTFVCMHGPTTKIDEPPEPAAPVGKRKLPPIKNDPFSKKIKAPAYFLRDIAQVVAMCDQVFPLAHISSELQQVGVRTSGVQVEEGGMGAVVRLVDIPYTKEMPSSSLPILYKHLLSATVRTTVMLKFNSNKSLVVEYVFTNCPVTSMSQREQSNRRPISFTYEAPSPDSTNKTVQAIVSDFMCIVKLYELVVAFARCYNISNDPTLSTVNGVSHHYGNVCSNLKVLNEIVKVRSFNYKSITLSYGPNYDAYVTVKYSMEKKAFSLTFGMTGCGVWATNAHTMLGTQLEDLLNHRGEFGLVSLVFLLHNTYQPMLALSKLQPSLHPGIVKSPAHPVQVFTVVAHSPTRVHIFYRNVYCLQVDFLSNGLISLRDGAYSSFQTSRVIEAFTPIKGLKAFLNKYVDETAISRRRSQSEDDNPPTPVPLDDSPWPTPKPNSPARHGPITPPVSSNPHTPASPHPGGVSTGGLGPFSSSPAAAGGFALSSPPSIPSMTSPAMMSHPSPSGGFLGGSSPSGQGLNVHSPSFPTPSPVGHPLSSHSPASSFLAGPTPLSQVSRMLPNRPYAAAIPTVLTHDAFHTLCSPPQVDHGRPMLGRCCVLEQFLGSTYLNKSIQAHVRSADSNMQPKDPSSCQIKLESLIATFILEAAPLYALSLKVQPTPEFSDRWTQEELQALELLFNNKASCPPYKPYAIDAMFNLFQFPYKLLRDCVKIIQLEMFPQQEMKWNVSWCLTVPPIGKKLFPNGIGAVLHSKNKYLFYIQITRANMNLPPDSEPTMLVLPIVYDMTSNKTEVAHKNVSEQSISDPSDRLIQTMREFMSRVPFSHLACSVYPCLKELMFSFTLGHESPVSMQTVAGSLPQQQVANAQQQQHQQVPVPSSVGGVAQSLPSPHLTSPHMSPHTPSSSSGSLLSSGGVTTTSVTMTVSQPSQVPHYTAVPGGATHLQPPGASTGMGLNHPSQGMAGLQGPMGTMGGMSHSGMTGNMIQGSHPNRNTMQASGMQNMNTMQPSMQGQNVFGNNMMGQFPR